MKSFSVPFVLDSLATDVFGPAISGWSPDKCSLRDLKPSSAYSWFKSAIWGGGFYIQYGHYRDFDKVTREWSEYPLLRLKFNPNKYWRSPVLERLIPWLNEMCDSGCLVKFDYAVDVPCPSESILVHSRKEPGLYKHSRYYGQRNKHGRLKVYDKRAESELPDDVTRVEWTFCCDKPIVFDDVVWLTHGPAPLPDASTMSAQTASLAHLLLYIRSLGGDVQLGLSYLDVRTQKKLEPYTIGRGVQLLSCFDCLVDLLCGYCNALSLSFRSGGVNPISIGADVSRLSGDDLEADDDALPL